MFKVSLFRFAFCFAAFTATTSMATAAPVQPVSAHAGIYGYIVLPSGTAVTVELNEQTAAEDVAVGNALEFKVRGDVRVNGKVVIKHGSRATGRVKNIKKGCNSKCFEITFTVEEVEAIDGQMVPLNSSPHIVKAPCCDGNTLAQIGTLVRANTMGEVEVKD